MLQLQQSGEENRGSRQHVHPREHIARAHSSPWFCPNSPRRVRHRRRSTQPDGLRAPGRSAPHSRTAAASAPIVAMSARVGSASPHGFTRTVAEGTRAYGCTPQQRRARRPSTSKPIDEGRVPALSGPSHRSVAAYLSTMPIITIKMVRSRTRKTRMKKAWNRPDSRALEQLSLPELEIHPPHPPRRRPG